MSPGLHLTIATPMGVLIDALEITALRAEDASGSFGIRPGHADLLTVLTPSVLRWRTPDQITHFCAVPGGVLHVTAGRVVSIACREAVPGAALATLEQDVHAMRERHLEAVRQARVEQTRLHAQTVRQLLKYLRPGASANEAWSGHEAGV
jgi:F-type H+-transporting ATPase subunit epsilon